MKHVSDKFEKELKLNAAQKKKLAAAFEVFFTDMDKLRAAEIKGKQPPPPPPPPPPANREAAEKLSRARDAQIKSILDAGQFTKYTALEKTMRPPGPGKRPAEPMPPPNERKE